jgi:methionyl-tRNA synthetase
MRNCERCKREYKPTSGAQKYCVDCGAIHKKEWKRAYAKKYYHNLFAGFPVKR